MCVVNIGKITYLMMDKCWSAAELQRRAGLSSVTLCHIKKNGGNARPTTVAKLAKALEVEPCEIMINKAI